MMPDLLRLASHLDAEGLRYVLIGGMAVMIHGGTRVTLDADIAIAFDLENRRRLVEALAPIHPRPMRLAEGAAWVWDEKCIRPPWSIFMADAGWLDLSSAYPGSKKALRVFTGGRRGEKLMKSGCEWLQLKTFSP